VQDEHQSNQLRLFMANSMVSGGNKSEDEGIVGGFGWMSKWGFLYTSYNHDEYIVKFKNLEQTPFFRKDGDSLVENVVPTSFAITEFHIVFMYPRNITVLSKISREIVASYKFDE
jgi:Pep3/Vps18/deep orange family